MNDQFVIIFTIMNTTKNVCKKVKSDLGFISPFIWVEMPPSLFKKVGKSLGFGTDKGQSPLDVPGAYYQSELPRKRQVISQQVYIFKLEKNWQKVGKYYHLAKK